MAQPAAEVDAISLFFHHATTFRLTPTSEGLDVLLQDCKIFTDACKKLSIRKKLAERKVLSDAVEHILVLVLRTIVGAALVEDTTTKEVLAELKDIPHLKLLQLAQALLRFVKSACRGVKASQKWVSECVAWAVIILLQSLKSLLRGSDKWNKEVVVLVKLGLQALTKAVHKNEEVAQWYAKKTYVQTLLYAIVLNKDQEGIGFDVLLLGMELLVASIQHEVCFKQLCEDPKQIGPFTMVEIAIICEKYQREEKEGEGNPAKDELAEKILGLCTEVGRKIVDGGLWRTMLRDLQKSKVVFFLSMWQGEAQRENWKSHGSQPMEELVKYYKELVENPASGCNCDPVCDSCNKVAAAGIMAAYAGQDRYDSSRNQDQRELLAVVLAELRTDLENLPAYKSALFALIVNVCSKRKVNQDFVRTHNKGLELIYNHSCAEKKEKSSSNLAAAALWSLYDDNEENMKAYLELKRQGGKDSLTAEMTGLKV